MTIEQQTVWLQWSNRSVNWLVG